MSTAEKLKRRWLKVLAFIACLVIPPPVYVAGAGPAVYGVVSGSLPRSVMMIFEPARAVMNASPWRREWIAYWSWWDEAASREAQRRGNLPKSFGWEYDVLLP